MARIAIEDFADKDIARVYFAARFAEALLVETEFEKNSIDYAVEVEPYLASAVFWVSQYYGAAFYVITGQVTYCRKVLREAGLTAGLMEEEFL